GLACQRAHARRIAEDACFWYGAALKESGRSEQAVVALRRFLRDHPRAPRRAEAAVVLGWLRLEAGDAAEAEELFHLATADVVPRVRQDAREGLDAVQRARAR